MVEYIKKLYLLNEHNKIIDTFFNKLDEEEQKEVSYLVIESCYKNNDKENFILIKDNPLFKSDNYVNEIVNMYEEKEKFTEILNYHKEKNNAKVVETFNRYSFQNDYLYDAVRYTIKAHYYLKNYQSAVDLFYKHKDLIIEKFDNNKSGFVFLTIVSLQKLRRYEEALEICESELFINNRNYQNVKNHNLMYIENKDKNLDTRNKDVLDKMDRLYKNMEYYEILKLFSSDDLTNEKLNSSLYYVIGSYYELEDYENIYLLYIKHKNIFKSFFKKIKFTLKMIIDACIYLEKYDIANEVCELPAFTEYYLYHEMKNKILTLKQEKDVSNSISIENTDMDNDKKNEIINILTRIYFGSIDLSLIDNLDIENIYKNVLKIAYYNKINKAYAINLIKKLRKEEITEEEDKILGYFNNLIQNSKSFYIGIYCNFFKCDIDLDLIKQLEDDMKITKVTKKEDTSNIIKKVDKPTKNKKAEKVIKTYYMNYSNKKSKNKKQSTLDVLKEVTIKNIYGDDIKKFRQYLYNNMQSDDYKLKEASIRVWDNFEVLINSNINDTKRLDEFFKVISTINNRGFSINIDKVKVKIKKPTQDYV